MINVYSLSIFMNFYESVRQTNEIRFEFPPEHFLWT
jgi:hypothetical protein